MNNTLEINSLNNKELVESYLSSALAQPGQYYYGDLYNQLTKSPIAPELQKWLELLEIYTFKTWNEYKKSTCGIALSDDQTIKLKELTIMSFAADKITLTFDEITNCIDLSGYELHKFLIGAIYHGVITGMIDTRKQLIELTNVKSREITPKDLEQIENNLDKWIDKLDEIIGRSKKELFEINQTSLAAMDKRQRIIESIRQKPIKQ